jgi:hypothetical protein
MNAKTRLFRTVVGALVLAALGGAVGATTAETRSRGVRIFDVGSASASAHDVDVDALGVAIVS